MTHLELGQEYIPPNEAEAIATVLQINERILNKTEKPVVKRGEHSKGHGCIRGRLVVDAGVADNPKLQVGLFKDPGEAFSVCIRYSNFSVKDDARGDLRGMAIKVFDVPGEKVLEAEKDEHTQDFLLVDYPVFVVRNAKDYIDLFLEIERTKSRSPVGFFITGFNPFRWRWHELLIGLAYRLKTVPSLFEAQYWSMTPYRLGAEAVKLTLIPAPENRRGSFWRRLGPRSKDYLREGMRDHLGDRGAAFDLWVQFQTDADKMPIEDPTIRWTSPFHKVATLTIPPQTFESPEQVEFCENLSFTPWHSLVAHQPLGGINRTRKIVYEQISRIRNQLNGAEHQELSLAEFDSIYPLNSDQP
ncbi:catalase [filamentous cyanobacterium CCT1]|nr:catalase [filamentous cyanobacterium CCT1]PSN81235.1 catalase [filamentous cyanobacterium CCP4]